MKSFKHLGTFLKKARELKKMTQEQLSHDVNVHCQYVSNWERGICAPPEKSYPDLIRVLKLNRDELLEAMLEDAKVEIEEKIYPERIQENYCI